ncbi:MAG: hypothetical protein U1E39_01265 [Planctomycetota bacterium]
MPNEPTRGPDALPRAAARADAGRCPWCGFPARPVAVHGHVQCATCGVNVDPCCGGETACPARDDGLDDAGA